MLLNNFSQEFVAVKTGIIQGLLSTYENNQHLPNVEMLQKIAIVLEIEYFELLYDTDIEVKSAFERWEKKLK
ncbi:MAG: helix-turn-helix transcriptional regulator [Lacibacter sp.]